LWLNALELDAFSIFHQSPDTANSNEEKTGSGTNASPLSFRGPSEWTKRSCGYYQRLRQRSIVILRVLASSAVIRVRAFFFLAGFSATRLFGMKGADCIADCPFSRT
jgi:hypothetical protein